MAASTGLCGLLYPAPRRPSTFGRDDQVFSMAVGAGGAVRDTHLQGPAVDGPIVLELNVWMALAAGGGDVQGIDTGFGVCGAFKGMNAMAIGAGCGGSYPPGRALSMNGHGVLLERLG